MDKLVARLRHDFPGLSFSRSNHFYWSPKTKQIFYSNELPNTHAKWSLLHETAHALLEHKSYNSDVELLNMEVAAWEKATTMATKYRINISQKHVQRCLDSYRDWLYERSTCPQCGLSGIQADASKKYYCHNCHNNWKVSGSRFCRTYREIAKEKTPSPRLISEGVPY